MLQAHNNLNQLAKLARVLNITWIKAHYGHDGNELADEYAKQGTIDASNYQFTLATKTEKKNIIEEKTMEYWKQKWVK